jgi:DNA mismatch endonuclease (patch repair protein)
VREVAFRKAVWRTGVRGYRVHPRLPGRPDMYFPRLRLAVFVHGCFWHRCRSCRLPEPKSNADFWRAKFEANAGRDQRVAKELAQMGIETLTVWEHEVRPDPVPRAVALAAEIGTRRSGCF